MPHDASAAGDTSARIRIDGAHGPLSDATRKRILDRLQAAGQDTDIFERHLEYEQEITGSPLSAGNKVTLLQDGPSTYQALVRRHGRGGELDRHGELHHRGRRSGPAFRQGAGRGPGARRRRQPDLRQRRLAAHAQAYFDDLRAHGVNVLEFNPVRPAERARRLAGHQRDHAS